MPPPPSTDQQDAINRVREERMKAAAAAGLGSTILTGGLGATDYGGTGKGQPSTLGSASSSTLT